MPKKLESKTVDVPVKNYVGAIANLVGVSDATTVIVRQPGASLTDKHPVTVTATKWVEAVTPEANDKNEGLSKPL